MRAGLNRWEETTGSTFGTGFDQRQLGVDPALFSQFTRVGFPVFDFAGTYQAMGPSRLISYGANDVYTIQPNLNLVLGTHLLKFGAEARKYNDNTPGSGQRGWRVYVSQGLDAGGRDSCRCGIRE